MDANPAGKGKSGDPDPPHDGWNVPLLADGQIVEQPAKQNTLTKRYTEASLRFIEQNQKEPFFLYLAHTFPHVPMFASEDFRGKSRAGIFGDAVEELDWSVGQILNQLSDLKLAERTLVVFTSDNGPWLIMGRQGGSAGPLRDGKGSTWEGGMRVPGIFWLPGRIKPTVTHSIASTMDLLPTVLSLAHCKLPEKTIDGRDISPLLFSDSLETNKMGDDKPFFYYRGDQLFACRVGEWKAHFRTQTGYGKAAAETHDPPLLFHLGTDPGEHRNVANAHPDVIEQIRSLVQSHQHSITPVPSQLQ
jgi:arylsulfatase A-like enzyme